jgi:hypothetical protein
MAQAFVANSNGTALSAPDDATYIVLRNEAADEAVATVLAGGDTDDIDAGDVLFSSSISALVAVAESAVAVLDSEGGVESMRELAAAVKAAGLGDFFGDDPVRYALRGQA